MLGICNSIGCTNNIGEGSDFCSECESQHNRNTPEQTMAQKYPKYYKPVGELTEVDVYAVHMLFDIKDASGCIHHASKKLLLSGVRTGGKSIYKDVMEARDTLTRWLQLYGDNH